MNQLTTTEGTLEVLGTVREHIGKKSKIAILDKNLLGSKRILVRVKDKNGVNIGSLTCSQSLSTDIRKGIVQKGELYHYDVAKNSEGVFFIVNEQSTEFVIEEVAKSNKKASYATIEQLDAAMAGMVF